ncbi:MAG: flagellar basal body P-ring formation chaperone FlgA [Gammaproteobacteria bacterium]|jgi:flagella basal body P-ring formation protein FlgA|uniref:Flagella basal body P-ring formation protein FlgA n=1 Tax=Xanthomonas boreopolis TaxID=86183 RepID=A0A919F4E8_9XANT|nr:flagellar basal body P-ring formation chaperone FlgA [Pseudomonas sp. Hp2]GHH46430.1 flagellar basal body P-ring biosynthesis protein FlgA [[Pseudomonas] boreopolis]
MRPILLLLLMATAPAWANGFQPVDSIRAAALSTLGPGTDAEATLDAGLRMPACAAPLQAQPTGSNTVEVACPGGWRLFVPVKVRRNQDVLVLNRGIAAGETIGLADIGIEKRDAARIAGAVLADPAEAVGKVARRVLQAGTLLSAGDLVSPRLVRRGDTVELVSRRSGLEVRMRGRALSDAGQDERVSVENASSRRIVQGTVDASGAVVVSR